MAEKTLKQKLADLTAAIAATDNHLHQIKENTANKVNSFGAATNKAVQFPTVKAVEDFVDGLKGGDDGFATLVDGTVPASQLPSYVDDVLEFANRAGFPATGETGKIYVSKDDNLTWRWTGTTYVEISKSLALGETSNTAYRGDRGKIAYDHTSLKNNPHGVTKAQVGLPKADNTSDMEKPVSTAQGQAINSVQRALDDYKDVIGHSPFPNYREMYLNSLDDMGSGTPITPDGPSIAVSAGVLDGGPERCQAPLTSILYYNGTADGINVGDTVYSDPNFSQANRYNGGSRWFNTDNGKLIQIAPDGQVMGITFCEIGGGDDGGGDGGTGTTGKHILLSSSSEAIHNEDGLNACRFGANTSRYYNGGTNIATGDRIYTDAAMTVTFNGSSRWWMTSQGKTVKVSLTGLVEMVGVCGDQYLPVEPTEP